MHGSGLDGTTAVVVVVVFVLREGLSGLLHFTRAATIAYHRP